MLAVNIGAFPTDPGGCVTCCCEVVALKPGETLPLRLNYAPWAVPIAPRGLHCAPTVEVEEKQTCDTAVSSNMPPQITSLDGMARFDTGTNVRLEGDLKTKVTDPEGLALTFKVLPLYGPKCGKLALNSDGTFAYTPVHDFKGTERFYCSAFDGVNTFIFEVMIAVGIDAGLISPMPTLAIGNPIVDARLYVVTIPLIASPAALTCQVFRLTVRQGALSCDCECYFHVDCVDVRIVKC